MNEPARWVSDKIVDQLGAAGVRHVAFNPGASFRGLHDSLVHRPGAPQIVLCTHEAVSVAVAHGYAKASGRPGVAALHNVVGLQNAAMAIYNAWCDRVPLLLIGGTGPMSTAERRPWIDWIHTANVQGEQVRDYVKWDDQPADEASLPRALARCLGLAQAQPAGPVYLCLDAGLQEQELSGVPWPQLDDFPLPTDPGAPPAELDELADRLRRARLPVLITDYAGDTVAGYDALVAVAESLHAPVIDRGARHNFPTDHELNFTELPEVVAEADLVVGVEVEDLHGALMAAGRTHPAGIVHIAAGHLHVRSWAHDVGELPAVERVITSTAAAALCGLAERMRDAGPEESRLAQRRSLVGGRARARRDALWREASRAESDGALHPARLAAEAWAALADHDPLVLHSRPTDWERRLWPLRGFAAHLGWHGGGGLGYGPGASIGAGLALRDQGRLLVDLQPDGDLLYCASALWTAAHLSVPVLFMVLNNRQYGNTVGHAARLGRARRGVAGDTLAGAGLADPPVDYAGLARSLGLWAGGPVADVRAIGPTLREAIAAVRSGRPALVEFLVAGA